jgi:hypothetical protein
MSSSFDYSSSDEEWDMSEDEDIAMILAIHHNNKRPKHGGSVLGREKLWRERIEGNNKLIHNYL